MRRLLPLLILAVLSACAGSSRQAETEKTHALATVAVAPYILQRKAPGGPAVDCAIASNRITLQKLMDTRSIAADLGRWFLHGLKSRAQAPLKMGKAVTGNGYYAALLPGRNSDHIAVGGYHVYGKKDYKRLYRLAASLDVDVILLLDLVPEFTIVESSRRRTSIQPGILVKARFIDSVDRKQSTKEYHYESKRRISANSLAAACVKVRRSFEYYDSHLAGIQAAAHLWQ